MNGNDRETLGEFGRRMERFEKDIKEDVTDLKASFKWVMGLQVTQTLLLLGSVIAAIILGAIK